MMESPDVAKDFPGLYASGSKKTSDSEEEKLTRLDILGKKKDSKKDKGYKVFEGESSDENLDESRSPGKSKKKSFKFPGKDRKEKSKVKEKKEEKLSKRSSKKEIRDSKTDIKDIEKVKKKKEINLIKLKHKKKKSVTQDAKEEKPIFGIPLHVAVERNKTRDGVELPVIIRECIDYIEEHGLACEGIYRISGLKSKVRQLKDQYNRGEKVYMYEHEPHVVASLVKQYLRNLPEPILTSELAPKFEEAAALKNGPLKVESLRKLLLQLPTCNQHLISWIVIHMLHVISMEKRNKMNLQNVYIVLSPTMQISHNILHAFFNNSDVLFSGVEIKKYVPPIDLDSSLELPDSPNSIAKELSKQENVLSVLHAELNTGLRDHQKEEQLWEIQRVVTQLKRKLRFLRQVQETSCPPLSCDLQTEKKSSPSHTVDNQSPTLHLSNTAIEEVILSENQIDDQPPEKTTCENLEEKSEPLENISDSIEKDASVTSSLDPSVTTLSNDTKAELPEESFVSETSDSNQAENEDDLNCLILKERILALKSDELILIREELRKKIHSEKMDMSRLKMEIQEYEKFYKFKKYSFDSAENSSLDDSSSSCDTEEDLPEILKDLMMDNKEMKEKNNEILKKIQHERELILNAKVQMKLLMQSRIFNNSTQEELLI
ncbi:ralA-binding protein 1-A isoform X2 [Parasteatoda tepidariorum]|nr:ralA-binding protein 1 isoform X2 [Parasteatoda tepidariorum]XP_015916545.1 ralA-binding protein 1 isoform X2 [Parasteatoda tepidariorum]XP_015916546.1 ralA-binding protein 1 isoform X2 [Parasteatoda tepidariorum]XP_015916548.1 ralA-binding protein 1 isoform X2 [Parasteatoda tepidariorum]XP_015916549.1 ralA-binding protein 1 isoform X2 [Parasteatoda tepidariorum]XP_042897322.1 ralA-binding protein 1 isoform X2 [Parasteatoda tepidariorum]